MKQYDNTTTSAKETFKNGKRRRKKGSLLGYFYLFVFSFVAVLIGVSYAVKTYSPDIDVTIGDNTEEIMFDDTVDFEARPIDERLKWIKSEDDIPAIEQKRLKTEEYDETEIIPKRGRFSDEPVVKETSENKNKVTRPPRPSVEETVNSPKITNAAEFLKNDSEYRDRGISDLQRSINKVGDNKENKPVDVFVTKVYIGNYSTADEAIEAQKNLATANPSLSPFVKNMNGKYIVQAGSFSDMQKADALMLKLREQGFSPKKYLDK